MFEQPDATAVSHRAGLEPTAPQRDGQLHGLCVSRNILCMHSAHTGTPKHEHLPIMLTPRAEHAADSKNCILIQNNSCPTMQGTPRYTLPVACTTNTLWRGKQGMCLEGYLWLEWRCY